MSMEGAERGHLSLTGRDLLSSNVFIDTSHVRRLITAKYHGELQDYTQPLGQVK